MNPDEVTEQGERVIQDTPNWGFYAHLSIYAFAGQFAAGKTVLDAGCGTGYGADYLLRKGARSVYAIDNSEAALQFCRTKYKDRRLQYIAADLTAFHSQELPSIDLLFCSNVLEHVWRVDTALAALTRCLTRDSVAVIAVPPVVDAGMLEGNLANPYHLNNLPPQTWMKKLGRFFEQVQGYRHWLRPRWLDENNWPISMDAAPEKTAIRETDFTFTASTMEEMASQTHTITSVILCRRPRPQPLPSCNDNLLPDHWNIDSIEKRVQSQYQATAPSFAKQWEGRTVAAIDCTGACRDLYLIRHGKKCPIPTKLWDSARGFGCPGGVKTVNRIALETLPTTDWIG